MKFATLRSGQVVGLTDGGYRAVNRASMIELIENPSGIEFSGEAMALPDELAPPIARPSKIWAAAGNYDRVNTKSPNDKSGRGQKTELSKHDLLHTIFLKPPSAIIGAGDKIAIPQGAGGVFPEPELCVVIGKRCRNVTLDEADSVIFGYTILVDVTSRNYGPGKSGKEMRCIRKGYDTFAPFGPVIVTRDEIPYPDKVTMKMWINGDLHQDSSTETMINNVQELVVFLSKVCTLEPGDLISTGTPDSPEYQRQLIEGDVVVCEIEGVGKMTLGIRNA